MDFYFYTLCKGGSSVFVFDEKRGGFNFFRKGRKSVVSVEADFRCLLFIKKSLLTFPEECAMLFSPNHSNSGCVIPTNRAYNSGSYMRLYQWSYCGSSLSGLAT